MAIFQYLLQKLMENPPEMQNQPSLAQFLSNALASTQRPNGIYEIQKKYEKVHPLEYKQFVQKCGMKLGQSFSLHHISSMAIIRSFFRRAIAQNEERVDKLLRQNVPLSFQNVNIQCYIMWMPNNLIYGPSEGDRLNDPKDQLEERMIKDQTSKEWKSFYEKLKKHAVNSLDNDQHLNYIEMAHDFLTLPAAKGMYWEMRNDNKWQCITPPKGELRNLPPYLSTDPQFLWS